MKVDGVVAAIGDRVDLSADVRIDGIPLRLDPTLITWLVYKPVGVITTMDDPHDRPTIRALVPDDPVTKPVGRLDMDSEGLILMTNDGELAQHVTHPRHGVAKTYHVLVDGSVTPGTLRRLTEGIELDDGVAAARRAKLVSSHGDRSIIELVMLEGRKREVRRMFAALDLEVERLVRTAIGSIADPRLEPGAYRRLEVSEIRSLYDTAKGPKPR